MKRTLSIVQIAVWLLVSLACHGKSDRSPVIANLNGSEIHRAEFERFLTSKLAELSSSDLPDAVKSQMLDEFVRRKLILADASRLGLTISVDEIQQSTDENHQIKTTAGTSEARDEIEKDLLIEKYYRQVVARDVRVSSDEIQQYIEKNQSRLTDRPGYLVREIRVQSREEAERLHREVTEGRRDFASVARLHSDAPSEQNGLVRYDEGQLPEVLDRAVKQLNPGDISPVIESNYGFHIFKLEQRIKPHAPEERRSQLDERRQQLAEELIARRNQQAVDNVLEKLTSESSIKINDSALGFTYTGQLRHN